MLQRDSTKLLIIYKNVPDKSFSVQCVTQSMKIVEKSKQIGIITFTGSTNLGLGLPTEDAHSDDPRLVSAC